MRLAPYSSDAPELHNYFLHPLQCADPSEKQSQVVSQTFKLGRPPQDGPLLQGTRPETQFDSSTTWETTDQQGRMTRASRFDEVHFQQDRDLILAVIRVERQAARGTKRDPRVSWFLGYAAPLGADTPTGCATRCRKAHCNRSIPREKTSQAGYTVQFKPTNMDGSP